MASVGRLSVTLEAKTSKFLAKMRNAEKALGRLTTKVRRLETLARNLDKALGQSSQAIAKVGQASGAAALQSQALAKGLAAAGKGAVKVGAAGTAAGAGVASAGEKAQKTSKDMNRLGVAMTVASLQMLAISSVAGRLAGVLFDVGRAVSDTSREIEFGLTEAASVAAGTAAGFDDAFSRFEATATRLAGTTQFTTTQVIGGLKFLAQAGLGVSKTLESIPQVLRLASAANVDVAKSADIVTNALTGFGETVERLPAVTNALVATLTNSNVNLLQLGEAFKNVSNVSRSFNASLEDTTTLLGLLGDSGIQGSEAGTGLKRAFSALANPSKKATKILKNFNLGLKDVSSTNGGAGVFVAKLAGAQQGLLDMGKEAQFSSRIFELFGQRAAPKVLALVKSGEEGVRAFARLRATITVLQREDIAKFLQEKKLATAQGQVDLLASAFEGLKDAIGKTLNKSVVPIISAITTLVNTIKALDDSTLKNVVSFIKYGLVLAGFTSALFATAGTFLFFASTLVGVRIGMLALADATGILGLSFRALRVSAITSLGLLAGLAIGFGIVELTSKRSGGAIEEFTLGLSDFITRINEVGIVKTGFEFLVIVISNLGKKFVLLAKAATAAKFALGDQDLTAFNDAIKMLDRLEDSITGLDTEIELKINAGVEVAQLKAARRRIEDEFARLVPGGLAQFQGPSRAPGGGVAGPDLDRALELAKRLKVIDDELKRLVPSAARTRRPVDEAAIAIDDEAARITDELLKAFEKARKGVKGEGAGGTGKGDLSAFMSQLMSALDLGTIRQLPIELRAAATSALGFVTKTNELEKSFEKVSSSLSSEQIGKFTDAIVDLRNATIDSAAAGLKGSASLSELETRASQLAEFLSSQGIPTTRAQILATDAAKEALENFADKLEETELKGLDELIAGFSKLGKQLAGGKLGFDPFAAKEQANESVASALLGGGDLLGAGAGAAAAGLGLPPEVGVAVSKALTGFFDKLLSQIPNEIIKMMVSALAPGVIVFAAALAVVGTGLLSLGLALAALGPLAIAAAALTAPLAFLVAVVTILGIAILTFGGVVGAFFALFTQTDAFERFKTDLVAIAKELTDAVDPAAVEVFSALVPVVRAVARALAVFFDSFSSATGGLGPVIFFLAKAFGFLILTALLVAGLFGDSFLTVIQLAVAGFGVLVAVASALAIAWDSVLIGIASFINDLTGELVIDPADAIARRAGNMDNLESLDRFNEELEKMKVSDDVANQFIALWNASQSLTDSTEDQKKAVDNLTESLVNVPNGVKVALQRFRSADAVDPGSVGGSTIPTPPGGERGGTMNVGTVIFENLMDFEEARESIDSIRDQNNSLNSGSPTGNDFFNGGGA